MSNSNQSDEERLARERDLETKGTSLDAEETAATKFRQASRIEDLRPGRLRAGGEPLEWWLQSQGDGWYVDPDGSA